MTKSSRCSLRFSAFSLLGTVLTSFTGCAASPQWQAAMAARDAAPGKFSEGKCKEFAQYVAQRVPGSRTLVWQWAAKSDFGSTPTAAHMVVTWQKGNEIWMMDNFSTPVWVSYVTTPRKEQVKQFFARSYRQARPGGPLEIPAIPAIEVTIARDPKN